VNLAAGVSMIVASDVFSEFSSNLFHSMIGSAMLGQDDPAVNNISVVTVVVAHQVGRR
jgi:hypothetical protein